MKTEAEIKVYRDALKWAVDVSCDCEGDGHAEECRIGEMAMRDAINTLSWVIGDLDCGDSLMMNERVKRMVAGFAEAMNGPPK